jgi:hypothetical protein
MASLRWLTSGAIMEATASPHREVHHAAPEPGGYEQSGWRTSALMRTSDIA